MLRFLITQNVDDLHRQAGHKALAEIHGNWKLIRCLQCGTRFQAREISLEVLPPSCPKCRGLLKADTVAFGEPIPPDVLRECAEHSARADLVILGGTSATVYPAAGFAIEVKERGGAPDRSEPLRIGDHAALRSEPARRLGRRAAAPDPDDFGASPRAPVSKPVA